MKLRTLAIIDAIRSYQPGAIIAPAILTHCFARSNVSPAIRAAKAEGLIEVAYISCAGSPCYRRTSVG